MHQLTPDIEPSELQAEIRRAGDSTGNVRTATAAGSGCVAMLLYPAVLLGAAGAVQAGILGAPIPTLLTLVTMGGLAVAAALLAAGRACFHRRKRTAQLGRRMAGLSGEEGAHALLSLTHDANGDVRKIAASLVREFGVRKEITPATAPKGRGDEAAAI